MLGYMYWQFSGFNGCTKVENFIKLKQISFTNSKTCKFFSNYEHLQVIYYNFTQNANQIGNTMKLLKNFIVVCFFMLLLFSCKQHGDIKLGFLIPATEGSRWIIDKGFVERIAAERGVEILIR